MNDITKNSAEAAPSVVVNVVAVICGLALVMFACVATSGLDMSAGFF